MENKIDVNFGFLGNRENYLAAGFSQDFRRIFVFDSIKNHGVCDTHDFLWKDGFWHGKIVFCYWLGVEI